MTLILTIICNILEELTEILKPFIKYAPESLHNSLIRLTTVLLGTLISLLFNLNLLGFIGVDINIENIYSIHIINGLILGLGTNLLHDIKDQYL